MTENSNVISYNMSEVITRAGELLQVLKQAGVRPDPLSLAGLIHLGVTEWGLRGGPKKGIQLLTEHAFEGITLDPECEAGTYAAELTPDGVRVVEVNS